MGLDTVEFVLEAEQWFGPQIPDQDVATIETVGQFSRYIQRRPAAREAATAPDEVAVFARICDQREEQFRIDRRQICRESRFVKDRGMD